MFCDRCGAQAGDAAFCPNCGQSLTPTAGATTPPPLWTAPSGVQADSARWLGEAWNLVMADLGPYAVLALIFGLLEGVPFIQGPLIAGFHIYTIKKLTGRHPQIGDLFQGFNFFLAALLASVVIGLFTFLGTLACIIPGLVIAAMYKFTFLFIVDKRMDFWQAMQASHAVVKNDYFGFTIFLILAFLVNVLGALCLVVGLLVTIPLTFAAITIAYREIVGFEPQTATSL